MREKKKTKVKLKQDKFLRVSAVDEELDDYANVAGLPKEMIINGNLDLGKNGNPVTILIEDEITGEQLEVSGVKNAFIAIEDVRSSTTGWMALAIGSVEKVADVLGFLSKTTLEALKRLTRKG